MRTSLGQFLKDNLVQIVGGAVMLVLGGIAWILLEIYAFNRTMGTIDARVSEHSSRIDRIAAALPDVRIRIAHDELAKPVNMAVIVRDTTKTPSGKWVTAVQVYDNVSKKSLTYVLSSKGPDDREVAWVVGGAAVEADKDAVSLSILSGMASDANKPAWSPADVVVQSSFVLRKPSAELNEKLGKFLLEKGATVRESSLPSDSVVTFDKLVQKLNNEPIDYSSIGAHNTKPVPQNQARKEDNL